MARILIMHAEGGPRAFLEARAKRHHEVHAVKDVSQALKSASRHAPDLILAQTSPKRSEASELLRRLKREALDIPVIVVAEPAAFPSQPALMKLGAADFLEYPMEQSTLDKAVAAALQKAKDAHDEKPPITQEEAGANLSELETSLNRRMQCFAGKNQVFLQSFVLGNGRTSKPRIALKCALRKKFGMPPDVYYEFIRDVCCGDPSGCPAYQQFQRRYSA